MIHIIELLHDEYKKHVQQEVQKLVNSGTDASVNFNLQDFVEFGKHYLTEVNVPVQTGYNVSGMFVKLQDGQQAALSDKRNIPAMKDEGIPITNVNSNYKNRMLPDTSIRIT